MAGLFPNNYYVESRAYSITTIGSITIPHSLSKKGAPLSENTLSPIVSVRSGIESLFRRLTTDKAHVRLAPIPHWTTLTYQELRRWSSLLTTTVFNITINKQWTRDQNNRWCILFGSEVVPAAWLQFLHILCMYTYTSVPLYIHVMKWENIGR